MSDAFKKVQTGQPLAIPAEAYNAFIDAANDLHARQRSRTQESKQGFRQTGIVRLKNGSDTDQDRFAILGIDQPIISPDDNLDAFRNEVTLVGVDPDSKEHAGRYAILLEPIRTGGIGLVVIAGVSIAKVDVKEECHAFAEITGGETQHLQSGTKGSAVILWKETGTGVKWAVVRIAGTDRGNASCDVCPEEEGSCAFEARFVSGGSGETEWVVVEEGCGEDYSCQDPAEPPTPQQATANEWTRTCCEPAMRDQGCGASCTWLWDGAAWVLDDNPCPEDCPCESPSEGLSGSSGEKTLTPCGQPPSGSGECATTTTAPAECAEAMCDSECRWVFSVGGGIREWVKLVGDCENLCCECAEPSREGEPCEETVTACVKRHGSEGAECGGECRAYFNFDSGTWVGEGCKAGCLCEHPTPEPPEEGECDSPMVKGNCVPNPCQGGCDWSWDGSAWSLQSSDCQGDCGCAPPGAAGSAGEVARTCCKPPEPTTTTTTSTTSTTTTKDCCDLPDVFEGRFIGLGDCSFDETITFQRVGDRDEWFWSGVLTCGDFYAVTMRCDRSKLPDCSAFTYDGYFPCAVNFRWVTNDDCQCDAPPYEVALATWYADDTTGCKCCQGGGDPSTTTASG